jgi:protein-L-isoaspartate(D-aspartate) O-methyltransferase
MFENERKELINKLLSNGIKDENVLHAMYEVQRHKFIPHALVHHAYKDIALPIGYGQTISQPFTVAVMTQALEAKSGSKILEIGTGSGYQATILNTMGMQVYTIERHLDIYLQTQKLFDELGLRINMKYGDGTIGWEEFSPYDGIIVTAGSPSIPLSLKKQLTVNGKLVIPVGTKKSQTLKVITKLPVEPGEDNKFDEKEIPEFMFVPLIGKEGWNDQN